MAKTKISEYSATASSNTDINSINLAEGMAPSLVNNAIRQLMAQLKDFQAGTAGDNVTVGGNLAVTGTSAFTGAISAPMTAGTIDGVPIGGTTTAATAYTLDASNTRSSGASAASYTSCDSIPRSRDVTKGSKKMSKGAQLCSSGLNNSFDAPISYKQFDTGTAWGKKLDDRVRREHFVKDSLLTEIVVYYASGPALFDMGIDLNETPRMAEEDDKMPKPFNPKYCQPPKGWVG